MARLIKINGKVTAAKRESSVQQWGSESHVHNMSELNRFAMPKGSYPVRLGGLIKVANKA